MLLPQNTTSTVMKEPSHTLNTYVYRLYVTLDEQTPCFLYCLVEWWCGNFPWWLRGTRRWCVYKAICVVLVLLSSPPFSYTVLWSIDSPSGTNTRHIKMNLFVSFKYVWFDQVCQPIAKYQSIHKEYVKASLKQTIAAETKYVSKYKTTYVLTEPC